MIDRIKQILTAPKTAWTVVESEYTPHVKLFTQYVLPLALIPAIAAFVGYGFVGYSVFGVRVHSIEWGIRQAVSQYIAMTGGVYLTAFVINFLAETFGARKDFDRAFSLVTWSYMPMFVGGVFYVIPSLSWLASLAGVYGLYLLYIGLQPMMKQPAEKTTGYFIACLVVAALIATVLSITLASILLGSYGAAAFRL
ncbi:MAG: YIP1 family protein [Prevotellaceae bacterium]|jgi:hypothetical protein|nr:YIP1 family protein [Prevotellaceae bacterium]